MILGVKIGVGTFLVWDLGLGSGEIQRPWSGPVVLETPHLGPRKFLQVENLVFKFLFWQIVDRTSPDIDMSKSQLVESWYDSGSQSLLILVLVIFVIMQWTMSNYWYTVLYVLTGGAINTQLCCNSNDSPSLG